MAEQPETTNQVEERGPDTASKPQPAPVFRGSWVTPGRFALLLFLLVVASFPGVIFGVRTFIVRDYGLFSYPVAFFQRQTLWHGQLPLWNPYNHCGLPFLAQWNTLAFYPPALIYLVLPLTWGLSLFCLGHLFWGGLGMYFLARRWTADALAGALAGVTFSFSGLMLNFLMWPSHVATYAWAPWVLALGLAGLRQGGRKWLWAALASGMQMLAGGPESIGFTWLLLLILAFLPNRMEGAPKEDGCPAPKIVFLRLAGMLLLTLLISSAQLLPFLQLLSNSQRDAGYAAVSHDYSIPFHAWGNFLVPLFRTIPTDQGIYFPEGQYWTTSFYAGIGTVLLAAIGVWRMNDWRTRSLLAFVILGLLVALGKHGPLYPAVQAAFPMLGFVRYPVKFVILILAVLPLLAASGFATFTSPRSLGPRQLAASRTLGAAAWLGAILLLILLAIIIFADRNSTLHDNALHVTLMNGLARAVALVLMLVLTAAFLRENGGRQMLFGCLLLIVFWLDLITHMPTQNPTAQTWAVTPGWARNQSEVQPEIKLGGSRTFLTGPAQDAIGLHPLPDLERNLLRNRLTARVNANLLDELPEIDGFYSLVPGPAFKMTKLPVNDSQREFPALLDFMGVAQVVTVNTNLDFSKRPTAMPLVTAGQQPVFTDAETTFAACTASNADLRHTVYLPPEAKDFITATNQPGARIRVSKFEAQDIQAEADSPGACMVVIAQTDYPCWHAYVDGQHARIWRANYAFQAIEVPAGRHDIQLKYEDSLLMAGGGLSGAGLLTALLIWSRTRFRETDLNEESRGI